MFLAGTSRAEHCFILHNFDVKIFITTKVFVKEIRQEITADTHNA
jgi:hypothetical protein